MHTHTHTLAFASLAKFPMLTTGYIMFQGFSREMFWGCWNSSTEDTKQQCQTA